MKFDEIRNEAFDLIKDEYTILPPFSLNAKDYGAPTSRSRVFFIGFKKNKINDFNYDVFYPDASIQKYYVGDAFKGLPTKVNIYSEQKTNELIWCKVEKPESNSYAELISKHIPEGVGNEEAINRYFHFSEVSGMIGTRHTKEVQERFTLIQPGEQDKVSRSIRLKLDGLCPTLRAGTDRDRGSFQAVRPIHPTEGRVITPREAARLQGFPDWFVFHPTKWHSFRQIGNSVSPIIAEYIFSKIIQKL